MVGEFPGESAKGRGGEGGVGGGRGEVVVGWTVHLEVSHQIDPLNTSRSLQTLLSHWSVSMLLLSSKAKIDLP